MSSNNDALPDRPTGQPQASHRRALPGGSSGGPLQLTQQPLTRTFSLFREPVDLNWEVDLFGRVRRNVRRRPRRAAGGRGGLRKHGPDGDGQRGHYEYFNLRAAWTRKITVVERTIKSREDALGISRRSGSRPG